MPNRILEFPEAAIDSINSEDPRQEELQPGEESKAKAEASATRPKDGVFVFGITGGGWISTDWLVISGWEKGKSLNSKDFVH